MLFSNVAIFATDPDSSLAPVTEETEAPSTVDDFESVYLDENLDELIVLEEITELREENVKHFSLSNGINKAVLYSQPIHYMDENGNWIDIDNSLTLQGNEYSTNNKTEIKFANKSGSNGLLSIKDGDYKIDFTPLNTNKVNVVIENPQENNSRKFDDVKKLNGLISKATYANVYDGIDIEYILTGNNIKENIIVNSKQDSYVYSFELKLNKLTAELSNGSTILSDSTTGEKVYTIPAPYMVDANGTYSMDVEYSLEQTNKWKYTFTVTASAEWINAEDRAFPVTIDPTVISTGTTIFDTFVMENENMDNSNDTLMVLGNFMGDTIGVLKYKNPIQLENYQKLVSVKATMFCLVFEDFYNIGKDLVATAYKIDGNGIEDKNYAECDAVVQAGSYADHITINAAGAYEFEIKDEYEQELNAYLTSTEEDKEFNITLALRITNLSDSEYMTARITTTEYASSYVPPRLELTYINTVGVENYYGMLTVDIGEYGTGYINTYNRSLTYINKLTTIANGDYEISAIYNSIERKWYYSFQESITLYDEDGIIKYLWRDPDGTIHCFAPYLQKNFWGEYVYYEELRKETDLGFTSELYEVRNPVVFYPEDDIDYVLTKTITGELILKGYDGNQKMFDENGRLIKICDASGNVLYFNYFMDDGHLETEDTHCVSSIVVKTTNNQIVNKINFNYRSHNRLAYIYNLENDEEIFIDWNNYKMTKIEYGEEGDGTYKKILLSYYTGSIPILWKANMICSEYTRYIDFDYYENNYKEILLATESLNNAKQKEYEIEYIIENEIIDGIEYEIKKTSCLDFGTNFTETNDDVLVKYTFDEKARIKSKNKSGAIISTEDFVYEDKLLPNDIYYTISFNQNIYNELGFNLVKYDIATEETEFLNFVEQNISETTQTGANMPVSSGIVKDTTANPYNRVCQIYAYYEGIQSPVPSTGFLCGDNIVLMSGHGLAEDITTNGIIDFSLPIKIEVIPGYYTDEDGISQAPYGIFEASTCYIPKEYYYLTDENDTKSFEFDWAVCVLQDGVGERLGYFDISITPTDISNKSISVIGYNNKKMHAYQGTVTSVEERRLFYNATTMNGMSGGPVFTNGSVCVVYGIHTSSAPGGTKINALIYSLVNVLNSE